jgi:putative nucleotidyltransferase with HDIG domain
VVIGSDSLRVQSAALLLALQLKDEATSAHSTRVASYSIRIGREMGISDEDLTALRLGALLHDIGKLRVSNALLNKTGRLTGEELEILREHPWRGENLVSALDFPESVCRIVGQNHERVDGSGYPFNLKGEDIALGARTVAVADTFDAITHDRPYHRGECYGVARHEIAGWAGTLFDADVVAAFERIPQSDWRLAH